MIKVELKKWLSKKSKKYFDYRPDARAAVEFALEAIFEDREGKFLFTDADKELFGTIVRIPPGFHLHSIEVRVDQPPARTVDPESGNGIPS